MPDLPSGDVTFLFTDIEGSTKLWESEPARMADALARHDALCRTIVAANRGAVVKMTGDGLYAVFGDPAGAVGAALELQRGMRAIAADCGLAFKIRCGLHAGIADERDGDYFGTVVNRGARLMSAAHGGQVLLSQAVVDRLDGRDVAGTGLVYLGRARLRDLSAPEDVWQLLHADLERTFPALRSLDSTPNNLPRQLTSFVGREQEMARTRELLGRTRLLTLTGSGGCGKTRLALQLAADVLDAFADGVWLVELAPIIDPGLVPQSVAAVLGVREAPGTSLTQALADHLRGRQALLVIDNAEHLLAACAQLAEVALRQCPQVVLLVSSREALGIGGEIAYRVPSLSMPDPAQAVTPEHLTQYESSRLFIERALAQSPQFAVTADNAPAVASICHRLDGIPLAIELAAARVRSLSVDEVNRRLDQRFRLLTGGSRTALPRQQTLRSTIDWSYNLLNAVERALFCRLAVFAGGWTLQAAESVCIGNGIDEADVLDLLTSLADKSLVLTDERGGAMRYRLLETVRQYARDRLVETGEGESWRNRHLRFFVTVTEEAAAHLRDPDQKQWLDRLETEHDNLRAALGWASAGAGDALAGLRLASALFMFWYVRGYFGEGRRWLEQLLAAPDVPPDLRGDAVGGIGVMAWQQGDYAAARRFNEEELAIRRKQGDKSALARALLNVGVVDFDQGRYDDARARFEEGLAIRRELGQKQGVAGALHNLAAVARACDDGASAWTRFEEALAIYRELKDPWGTAISLSNLGSLAAERPDHRTTQALFRESLAIRQEIGDRRGIAESLEGLANVACALGLPDRALRIWAAAERLREEIGAPLPPLDRRDHELRVTAARASVSGAVFDSAWREGRAMTLAEAIAFAMRA